MGARGLCTAEVGVRFPSPPPNCSGELGRVGRGGARLRGKAPRPAGGRPFASLGESRRAVSATQGDRRRRRGLEPPASQLGYYLSQSKSRGGFCSNQGGGW